MADYMRITIDGLPELRAAVRSAVGRAPRELTMAIKAGGKPIVEAAKGKIPVLSGALSGSLKVSARGTVGDIVSTVPYAGGAEWGQRGKWTAWVNKHGAAPRFVWPSVEEKADEAMDAIAREMREVLTVLGWFNGNI